MSRSREVKWGMNDICSQYCSRYEECPLMYECKIIKEIGDRIEDILNDHPNLGVE